MAFLDTWVVDKTMFDYVSQGGGCACCGITHALMNWDKLQECSDWDTDDEQRELFSPWPTFIHEDVQTQRCMIRASLKHQLESYASFLDTDGDPFQAWFSALPLSAKHRAFQVPESELLHYIGAHDCNIHGPYGIVLKAVTEQIKNFHVTKYQDGRHPAEVYLEKHLKFAKGAFSLSDEFLDAPESFLACLRYLGGPRLFPAAPLCADNNEDIPTPTAANEQFVQSFRSDRRLLRLVIVRCFADMLRRKYTRECPSAGGDAPSATQHALFDNCSNNDESIEPLKSTNAIKFNVRNARVLQ